MVGWEDSEGEDCQVEATHTGRLMEVEDGAE